MRVPIYEPEGVLLTIVLNLAVTVGVCVLGVKVIESSSSEPDYAKITHYGCTVTQTEDFNYRWQLHVWADYERAKKPPTPHDFETLYSVRDNRKQALKDCDKWMDDTLKHTR